MARFPTMLTDDRYVRFSRSWLWPEFVAAAIALVVLIADVGWSRSLGLSPWLTVSIEAVLAAVLLVRVPVAMMTPLPEFVEEQRMSSRRSPRVRQKSTIMRAVGAFSQRFRLRRRLPRALEPFRRVAERCPGEGVILALAVTGFLLTTLSDDPVSEFPAGIRLTLFGAGAIYLVNSLKSFQRLRVPPLQLFSGTYAALILLGGLLLSSPRSTVAEGSLSFVDSCFMAASASCVTGLAVLDVGTELTGAGQAILLLLVQIGGLGIMTFAAFASIVVGAGMSMRDRRAISEVLDYDVVGRVGKLVLWILGITIVCEGTGALILYSQLESGAAVAGTEASRIWWSVFQSISSFCNAGFSLDATSLMGHSGLHGGGVNWTVMLTVAALIIVGGLGFTVIMDLSTFKFWHMPLVRRTRLVGTFIKRHPVPRLSLQTKLVLIATFTLIVGGGVVFWLLESGVFGGDGVLAGASPATQAVNAAFHGGITTRTAGFNTVDVAALQPETQFFSVLMMLVGASPGSTGGGIKTTAMVILLLVLWSSLRGRPPEVFRRRINDDQVRRVLLALVTILIVLNLAVFLMLIAEGGRPDSPSFMDLTFEVVSAFTTTGLSTGITADLSDAGKVILTVCMFLGRIGPISLVLALGRKPTARYEYPGESVMLG